LKADVEGVPDMDDKKKSFHASATFDEKTGEVVIKAVNAADRALGTTIVLQSPAKVGKMAKVVLLASDALTDENSIQAPKKVYPKDLSIQIGGRRFAYEFQPYSLTIIRVPVK
jgi:alpha-L-arabinofuranosidase